MPADERADAEETVENALDDLNDVAAEGTVIEHDEVVDAITDRAADHDLTIIVATREGLVQCVLFGGIPERVGKEAESIVILAKRNLDIMSRLQRLFNWE